MNKEIEYLNKYATNVNLLVEETNFTLIGRNEELRSIMQTLVRIEKSSPILIGDPGTGKTSIVYGLARLINEGVAHKNLNEYTIYELNINSLYANAKFRGDLEDRIEKVLKYAADKKNKIILFIDEVHVIAQGVEYKISDVIKPYIASGKIKCIGATTSDEYAKHIEKDKALKRRFSVVYVKEPSIGETINIISGIKNKLEAYYSVRVPYKSIVYAAECSSKYFVAAFRPDSTIDLIDETLSRTNFEMYVEPLEIANIQERIQDMKLELYHRNKDQYKDEDDLEKIKQLEIEIANASKEHDAKKKVWIQEKEIALKINELKNKIHKLGVDARQLKRIGNFDAAGQIIYSDIPKYQQVLNDLESKFDSKYINIYISKHDIAKTIHLKTGIPISKIIYNSNVIFELESFLGASIVGQKHAIESVCRQMQLVFSGFKIKSGPSAVLFFAGPTGVGKTEMAKKINEFLFNSQDNMVYMDMSEYTEEYTVSALFGSAPGYVGYQDEGILTGPVRKRPYRVVLFDEIEKAHPVIYDTLLAILDHGVIVDRSGRKVDFRETVIIFTSNINVNSAKQIINEDECYSYQAIVDEMSKHFRKEFINRIDEITVFNSLTTEDEMAIIRLNIDAIFNQVYIEKNIKIVYTENVVTYIVNIRSGNDFGAREIKRKVYKYLINPLVKRLSEIKSYSSKCHVNICVDNNVLQIQINDSV